MAGMLAGADSIDDMNLLRHGGMGRLFARTYAPSTLGSFLRAFTFGHVRQLDAVASRVLQNLASRVPLLFDTFRHHAFFTTTPAEEIDTVVADKTHRGHAIIEQVHADLKHGPLAHLPSGGVHPNSAWLVLAVLAFNLTGTAGIIADRAGRLARATTATIRRTLISIPARLARSAHRVTMHLPEAWPWENAFTRLFTLTHAPPPSATV